MAQVFKLYRLQQFDTQIDQALQRITELDRLIADESSIQAAEEKLREAVQRIYHGQSKVKAIESEVLGLKVRFDQNQASLYGGRITNPKELQDLQQESAALQRQMSGKEDVLLNAMIELEQVEGDHNQAIVAREEAIKTYTQKTAQWSAEREQLNMRLERLRKERETVAKTTPEDELMLYEEIRKKRKGIAVSSVTDRFCSACGSSLSALLLQAAKSPSHLARCDTCGRILYIG